MRDPDRDHLDVEPGEVFDQLVGASVHYRIAIGPNAGRRALTLRTVPALGAPRHPKPGQAVLEHRLTSVCGLDVGDAPIRASICAFPSPATSRHTVRGPTRCQPQPIPIDRTPQTTPFGRLSFLCSGRSCWLYTQN